MKVSQVNYQNQRQNFTAQIEAPPEFWNAIKNPSSHVKNAVIQALKIIDYDNPSEVLRFNYRPEENLHFVGDAVSPTITKKNTNWISFLIHVAEQFQNKANAETKLEDLITIVKFFNLV